MNQTSHPIAVPHQLRESVITGDGFVQQMRARGWSVADVQPIYTDPKVIRQPWLVCPNGARYSDRVFYRLFGITCFRQLLRAALLRTPCATTTFASLCPDASELHTYLTFLRDQELLHNEGNVWSRGKRLFQISDIGHTLEWYIAEWFRLTQTCRSQHVIPIRHGVTFHRSLDVGDIDVVAFLDSWTVMLECKSSSKISTNELALFLKRATLLQPAIAVLLIDTPTLSPDGPIRRLNALLARNGEEPLLPVASVKGVYWGAKHMCVTCVSQSLPSALEAVLQVIEQQMSLLTEE